MEHDLVTREEAAEHFRVSTDTLDRWRRSGKGPPSIKLPGGAIRYSRAAIATYTEALAAAAS